MTINEEIEKILDDIQFYELADDIKKEINNYIERKKYAR